MPVGSLQNLLIDQALEFNVISGAWVSRFFTVVEITGSPSGAKHPTPKIFDSLCNELLWETKDQIAILLQTKESVITLVFTNIHVIYLLQLSAIVHTHVAIAFAFGNLYWAKPRGANIPDPKDGSSPLCLEDKQMHHFPANTCQRQQNICRVEKVSVYSKCLLQEEGHTPKKSSTGTRSYKQLRQFGEVHT